jgi:hypothetical protein
MTACAPTTKSLIRTLFPWFSRSRTTAYSSASIPARRPSGGAFKNFNFALPSTKNTTDVEEIDMTGPTTPRFAIQKGDNRHSMKRVESVSSLGTGKTYAEKRSVEEHAHGANATMSLGQMAEAIPEHCLGHAR